VVELLPSKQAVARSNRVSRSTYASTQFALLWAYNTGAALSEIARYLGRQEDGINSRLPKLG